MQTGIIGCTRFSQNHIGEAETTINQ
jgi:hypothetical protein